MEIRQLRYFVAVAEELNFNRAAERVYISQSALSRQIQQLEEDIAAVLLERNSKRVALTAAGEAFYHHAQRILGELQFAAEESKSLSSGQRGSLAIGIFGSAILDFIPQVLKRFTTAYPGVRIALHQMDKDAQIQALRERRLTIGFNRLVPAEPDIAQEEVRHEPLMLALGEGHRLAQQPSIDLADMLDEPLILYPRGVRGSLVTQIQRMYEHYAAQPVVAHEVSDVTTSIALVGGGLGVSIVPRAAINLRLPGVVYRPLHSRGDSTIELICLYRKGDQSPVLQSFLKVLRDLKDASVEAAS
ncbi:LysR family transcriptional regulator [Pseudomonas sp. GCM10022188]|uniref:LysR family transcriptional regulator n=1 Tax=Pseudomonas TaxID=286 RepID=UPI001E418C7F|nr:LysR family transcriptional regulator [Pseudomonas oryzagri]MCC6073948.1 LysR family transcriptional regulator [Pseudomonas oryzagri]